MVFGTMTEFVEFRTLSQFVIFRAKINNNCFFLFFAIFYSELSQKNIFTCTYLYFFGDILHILWSKNKEVGYYASFGEFTE